MHSNKWKKRKKWKKNGKKEMTGKRKPSLNDLKERERKNNLNQDF